MPKHTAAEQRKNRKVAKVMGESKRGSLRSSSGQKVRTRAQATAIALSEGRRAATEGKAPVSTRHLGTFHDRRRGSRERFIR